MILVEISRAHGGTVDEAVGICWARNRFLPHSQPDQLPYAKPVSCRTIGNSLNAVNSGVRIGVVFKLRHP
jgi:hypothetical protein